MVPSKIMIIRHAEKPGIYGNAVKKAAYSGINALGEPDPASLVTMGWERAGGIANLFCPTNGVFQDQRLATPNAIYASNPTLPGKYTFLPNGNYVLEGTSQRPSQTISALYGKANIKLPVAALNLSFAAEDYADMVADVLTSSATNVLIAWQHQYILPKATGDDSIVAELFAKTKTPAVSCPCPTTPWPGERYDMVLALELDTTTGYITSINQVPQMLLWGDLTSNIF